MTAKILIYTDGGCSPNPGLGSYAWYMEARDGGKILKTREYSNVVAYSTNQRMELTAAISALSALTRPAQATLISDSEYLVKGITEWMPNWVKNGWRNARKKPVENKDLWVRLHDILLIDQHTIQWEWTRGHANNDGNNRVDELCVQARGFANHPDYVWIHDHTSGQCFIEKRDVWMSGEYDNPRKMEIVEMVTYETAVQLSRKYQTGE